MSPLMGQAMRSVEESCGWDVSTLCSMPGEMPSDPLMNWIMNPFASPPMGDSLTSMLNSMMDSAVRLADAQPMYVVITSIDNSRSEEETASDQVFDSMVSGLADHVASSSADEPEKEEAQEGVAVPVWDPVEFSKRLVEHGKEVLNEPEGDELRRRLARRLTEVHPDMFHGPRNSPRLPFGCYKNRCLMSAYEQGAVSPRCADALRHVEQVEQAEVTHHMLVVEREQEAFFGLAILYGVLCIGTLLLLHRRLSKYGQRMRGSQRLKRRILQAVYNNPGIKAAVAADLREELGYVPPLSPHVLDRISGKDHRQNWKMLRLLKLGILTGVLVLAFVNPLLAMPIMCILVGFRFFQLAYCPPKIPQQCCCCCCCGLSTDDVAAGNITAAQACCKCCNGTGVPSPTMLDDKDCTCCCCGVSKADVAAGRVTSAQACCSCCKGTGTCAPSCASCCGGDGGCCCCGDDCCCSESSAPRVRHAKEHAYMGIPVQVV